MKRIQRPARAPRWQRIQSVRFIALAGVALACSESPPDAQGPADSAVPSDAPVEPEPEPPWGPPGCEAPLDQSAATRFYDAVRCVFEGDAASQRELQAGVIDPERASVLRGRVLDEEGAPIVGARVEVLEHGEYGWTETRGDGNYDLVANGGGQLTIRVTGQGYMRAQRHLQTRWRRFETFPDIVLVRPAEASEPVVLTDLQEPTLLNGPVSADGDGQRHHAVVASPGQVVRAILPDGTEQLLRSMSLRATEFTVGERGPQAMPADLPETSAYTYALDLSLVEAEALGAEEVTFDPPLINYVDNFLRFPAGTVVPVGVYDEQRDVWQAEKSGLVIALVGVEEDLAQIDIDGDGNADDDAVLEEVGITSEERRLLAREYAEGASLWRVETAHFSTWDCNWPFGFPEDAIEALANVLAFGPKDCKRTVGGSIIGCEDQTLGEVLPVTGTPYRLHYQSERMPGRLDRYSLSIDLAGAEIPPSLKRIDLQIDVHGQTFQQSFEPAPNLIHEWVWDGKDAYGRQWQGRAPADVKVGYVYDGAYESTDRFGQVGSGSPITGDRSREEITSWAKWTGMVGGFNHAGLGLGGWTLDVHHVLDREGGTLHLGTGQRRSAESMGPTIRTVAGTGTDGWEGDGGPATEAVIAQPHGLAIAPDGTAFFSEEQNHRIRRIHPDGTIDTYAGNGETGSEGDGGPATEAALGSPLGIALAKDGTLYVTQRLEQKVRAITPDGRIHTFAGGGETPYPDGVPATEAEFWEPHSLAFGPDGSLYIVDSGLGRVYRIGPDGIVFPVAGDGSSHVLGDGSPAFDADFDNVIGIAVDQAGAIYLTEYEGCRVRRIAPTGLISTVAGTGECGFSGDGGPATAALINEPHDIQLGVDGSIYFSDEGNGRIRRIRLDGIIETVAGSGESDYRNLGDGGPPLQASFSTPRVVYAHHDGSLWIGDYSGDRIRRIDPPLPGFSMGESFVAATDASEIYVFDALGRHVRTLEALTGFVRLSFAYDTFGLLQSVTDGFGNTTTVQRESEKATGLIAPFGQQTSLGIDDRGFLAQLTDPAGAVSTLSYTDTGLLTQYSEPVSGEVHSFSYDDAGLLVRDESPSGYFQSFSHAPNPNGFVVTRTHRDARPELHEVLESPEGIERRVLTNAAGISQTTERAPSRTTRSGPWGTETVLLSGDPRFGMQAPLSAERTLTLPDGASLTVTKQREVTLSKRSDPLSIESIEEETERGNNRWTSTWDASARTWTQKSPEYREQSTVLNEAGQVASTRYADLLPIIYDYDDRGRLSAIHHGERTTSYAFGADGLVSSITSALGEVLTYQRNALGQVTRQQFEDGSEILYAFDQNRRLTAVTPSVRAAHQLTYAPGSLLSAYEPPPVPSAVGLSFAYDPFDMLSSIDDGTGALLGFTYEPSTGRLAQIEQPEENFSFSYDPASGQLSSVAGSEVTVSQEVLGSLPSELRWAGAVTGAVTWTYDENFKVAEEDVLGHTVSFSYDDDGLITKAGDLTFRRDYDTGFITDASLGNWDDEWSFNDYGEMVGRTGDSRFPPLIEVTFGRDALGRVSTRTETIDDVIHEFAYSYDARGRLVEVQQDGTVVESYSYDDNDNRLTAAVSGAESAATYDAQDRLLSYGQATYTRSAAGDLVRKEEGGAVTDYHYDRRGSLRSVQLPDARKIDYVIDGLGRRIGKRINGALTAGWLYRDALSPVAELGADGKTLVSRFVYGPNPHVPEYMVRDGKTYRFVTDQVGSVRLVVDVSDGSIAQRIDYTTFGEVLLDTNPGFQPFGFAAGLTDPDTSLVRFGARDYDPHTGRWTARDPILFAGLQANLYVYVGNDPVNLVDPNGRLGQIAVGAIVGGVAGAVAGGISGYVANGDLQGVAAGALGGAVSGALSGGIAASGLGLGGLLGMGGANALGGLVGDFANLRVGGKATSVGQYAQTAAIRFGGGVLAGVFGMGLGAAAGSPGGNLEALITGGPSILSGTGWNVFADYLSPQQCAFGDSH